MVAVTETETAITAADTIITAVITMAVTDRTVKAADLQVLRHDRDTRTASATETVRVVITTADLTVTAARADSRVTVAADLLLEIMVRAADLTEAVRHVLAAVLQVLCLQCFRTVHLLSRHLKVRSRFINARMKNSTMIISLKAKRR